MSRPVTSGDRKQPTEGVVALSGRIRKSTEFAVVGLTKGSISTVGRSIRLPNSNGIMM